MPRLRPRTMNEPMLTANITSDRMVVMVDFPMKSMLVFFLKNSMDRS